MKRVRGIGASGGIAMGRLEIYRGGERSFERQRVEDVEAELRRLQAAQAKAAEALNEIYLKSLKLVGEKDSMIFQIHIMMLQDEDFSEMIQKTIRTEQVNAEFAVWTAGNEFSKRFECMEDEYMRSRKTDVIDISRRLIQCLDHSESVDSYCLSQPSVLVAEDLTPSDTMQLDRSKLLAVVTRGGSKMSHMAILSRTMGIPAVVSLEEGYGELQNGMFAVIDGLSGEVLLEPDEETVAEYEKIQNESLRRYSSLSGLISRSVATKDGTGIEINANIGHPNDAESALKNGADGIGLFRSEFLYMESRELPSEEKQFRAYREILEKMNGRRVIVRTFDIGADKKVPYLNLPEEDNPALGYRAIRICLDRQELFYTQLRALLRASTYGNLAVMFPMIVSVDEIKAAKAMVQKVQDDLKDENISFCSNMPVGIMVETPAAVMLSGELAKEVDFFSIGTNDLTQYTLAADRINAKVADLYDQKHPAVLKMIELVMQNARRAGIPAGICGESAADPALTEFFLRMGVQELSVVPASVLELKQRIEEIDLSKGPKGTE